MIPFRVKGLCLAAFKSPVRLPDVDKAPHTVAGFQLWMWGLKNDSTNDRGTSPLEEKFLAVIPLVPLFTVSL